MFEDSAVPVGFRDMVPEEPVVFRRLRAQQPVLFFTRLNACVLDVVALGASCLDLDFKVFAP